MVGPAGKKLILGKDISIDEVMKRFAKKMKKPKKSVKTSKVRKLGPAVVIPPKFLEAQDLLVKKLISNHRNVRPGKNAKLAGNENILGIHIGQKLIKGEPEGSLAVVVTVRKKIKDQKKIHSKYRIPKRIKVKGGWVPVDVKLGGNMVPHAIGGELCTLDQTGAKRVGAIGVYCYYTVTGGHFDGLLTNNHVIGRFANGKPTQDVTSDTVFDFSGNPIAGDPLRCGTLDDASDNLSIDAAVGTSLGGTDPADANRHVDLHFTGNIRTAAEGDVVIMYGSESKKRTRGTVLHVFPARDVDYTNYPIGRHIMIRGVFAITPETPPFSTEGDSGSLIIHESSGDPVGILIAGGDDPQLGGPISIAADLATVQADLGFDGIHAVP